jgi:hypothetical protein
MAKRKSTGKRQRFNIFKRDRFTCQYCGRTPPTIVLVIDHILPVSKGGTSDDHNLITSCEACNQGKADGLLSIVPQSVETQLAEQVERHEQLREFNKYLLQARKETTALANDMLATWNEQAGNTPDGFDYQANNREYLATFKRFMARLPAADVYEAIDIAMSKKPPGYSDKYTFKYFCGVCWNKIKKREGTE